LQSKIYQSALAFTYTEHTMRLKSLELKGFKSFAEKTVINFNEDVIGIVGSNGCGKSNIVDSIRWVLGEQKTKQLRSDSMTNVIFNGTKSRKASGLAEVTLNFENNKGILPTEFQDVSIKRILYKDGSGEYYLNGIKCRLKDITNLLSDTGMGPDSYAIIALGMVDDLLADKDNSRLRLFEQAAGVSKYKLRKKETLSKLHQTEEDLARVEDLLFEIEGQVKTLEKQAKRAKRYLEIKAEYKTLSIELHCIKINSLKNNYKTLENRILQEKLALEQSEKQVSILEKEVDKAKSSHLEQEQQLSLAQKQLNSLVGRIKNKENDSKMLSQKTLFIQQNNEKLENRIESANLKLAETEKDISKFQHEVTSEEEILEIYNAELQEAFDELEKIRKKHGDLKSELDNYLQQQKQLNNRIVDAEKQIAVNQSQQENFRKQLQQLNERLEQRRAEMEVVLSQSKQIETELYVQQNLLKELKDAENKRQADLQGAEEALEKCTEELNAQNRILDAKRNEFQLLKSLVENMEGFPESIKFLSKDKTWAQSAPLLSDLFYCQPEYRAAIENYLEGMLSYYVVKNVKEAAAAVYLLDKNKKGKANFLLLDKISIADNSIKTQTNKGVPALSVLEFDSEYSALAEHLLSNVYIVTDIDDAENGEKGIVWLSKDGRMTNKGISLHGGSVGAFEGKTIGRKKNLELLQKEIESLQGRATTLSQQQQELRKQVAEYKAANKQRDIQRNEQVLQQLSEKSIGLKSKLDNFEQFKNDTELQKTQLEDQIKQLRSKTRDLEGDMEYLEEQGEQLNEQLSKKDSSFKTVAEELSKISSAYNQKHIEQVRQQNKLSGIRKELEFCERQHQEIKVQLERDRQQLYQAGSELGGVQQDINKIDTDLQELYEEKKVMQAQLSDAEKEFFRVRGSIHEVEEALRKGQKNLQMAIQLVHQLENQFNEVKIQLSTIGERLKVEFELNINDLINREPNLELDGDELEQQVEKMRRQINEYGAVNPMAIEAYDEAKERFDFISQQRQDLISSKETLLETISEIDATATKLFMNAFNEARENFVKVFRSLFEEDDTCDLILSDPQNPLESKIEIIAKPKGKRPLSINQLSGGEKTLTATALLFSLYLLKPAPFCIFDEVDAPLDDANIAKFNNIIKDFSANSQFIIVTHNKKTMASVDIMYGVTMVQGVSKVVPVDFRELEMVE
jgi:chromosome segregation protein